MPIRVVYVYNCNCEDLKGPRRTSRPYSLEAQDAITPAAVITSADLVDFLTSRPYSVESVDAITPEGTELFAGRLMVPPLDAVSSALLLTAGTLRMVFLEYDAGVEAVTPAMLLTEGELRTLLLAYADGLPEAIESAATLTEGTLDAVLIQYTNGLPEAITSAAVLQSGTLV